MIVVDEINGGFKVVFEAPNDDDEWLDDDEDDFDCLEDRLEYLLNKKDGE